MAVVVRIPQVLRRYSAGEGEVAVEGETVREALEALLARHPGLRPRVIDETGALYPYLALFRAGEPIDLAAPLRNGDTVELVGAAAGG